MFWRRRRCWWEEVRTYLGTYVTGHLSSCFKLPNSCLQVIKQPQPPHRSCPASYPLIITSITIITTSTKLIHTSTKLIRTLTYKPTHTSKNAVFHRAFCPLLSPPCGY